MRNRFSSLRRDLNMSATNITSKCRIASISLDDAMILAALRMRSVIVSTSPTSVLS
jgi:hypothetical protein